jgi:acetyl-CoA carboxylase, carboxyl transferase, beta subunit
MKLFGKKQSTAVRSSASRESVMFMEPAKYNDEDTNPESESEESFTCSGCNFVTTLSEIKKNLYVCPKCGKHNRISAIRRVRALADKGTFKRLKIDIPVLDPLGYPDYDSKIKKLQDDTGLDEAVLSGVCEIEGIKCVVAVMAGEFLMGSMGIAVGEKITRSFEAAEKLGLPIIIFTASGGARMQEGILSLMQMAKTSAAVKRFSDNGGLYISVLTHPTTGGVSASFATLADITLAEPGALIGFAGPRVIEQTIGQKLPQGFQRAEFQLDHGFVDQIVERGDMRRVLAQILRLHK